MVANAMFIVPKVTMKEGSFALVTRRPLIKPNSAVTPMPQRMAKPTGNSFSTASLVITIDPSAITMPQDKSMPAVRMMSVMPMANTPTTITCCVIRERFSPVKKRSDCVAKKRQAAARAIHGPSTFHGRFLIACFILCTLSLNQLTSCPSTWPGLWWCRCCQCL